VVAQNRRFGYCCHSNQFQSRYECVHFRWYRVAVQMSRPPSRTQGSRKKNGILDSKIEFQRGPFEIHVIICGAAVRVYVRKLECGYST